MEKYGIEPYNEATGKGLVRHVLIRYGYFTKEVMVCLILNGNKIPKEEQLVKSLCEIPGMTSITINVNKKHSNVILGEEIRLLWGQEYITDRIGDISYQISPLSFYQVNPMQTQKLYAKALEYADLHGQETVWDLYCGIGENTDYLLRSLKKVLSDKEYQVICCRYGLFGMEEETQREIARKLCISRSYVSRIEKTALQKLRGLFPQTQ